MSLLNINPTSTASWKGLQDHFEEIKDVQMKSLFLGDSNRKKNMSRNSAPRDGNIHPAGCHARP